MIEHLRCSDDVFRLEVAEWAATLALEQVTSPEDIELLRCFRSLIRAEIRQFCEENWEGIVYWLEAEGFDPDDAELG